MPPAQRHVKSAGVRRPDGSSKTLDRTPSTETSQTTIPGLFATTKPDVNTDVLDHNSPSKRRKTKHCAEHPYNTMTTTRVLGTDQMYDFTPNIHHGKMNGQASNPITIGDSPVSCPTKSALNTTRRQHTSSKSGPKKLVVKNLKPASKVDPNKYIEEVWSRLKGGLSAIFAGQSLPYSMEELYKGVENICRQGSAAKLYDRLRRECETQLDEQMRTLSKREKCCQNNVDILRAMIQTISSWTQQMSTIRSVFYYLDRSFLLRSAEHAPLDQFTVTQFRHHVVSQTNIVEQAVLGACQLASSRRKNLVDDDGLQLLKAAVKMFRVLDLYVSHFEPLYLRQIADHYSEWSADTIVKGGLATYVRGCQDHMSQELEACVELGLDTQTRWTVQESLENVFVTAQERHLLNEKEVIDLLSEDSISPLSHLYALLQRRSLGLRLKPIFEKFIVDTGTDIIFDEPREQEMVLRLLGFKQKLDRLWEQAFLKNEDLGHTLREAFEIFINKTKRSNMTWGTDNSKPGEMIAKYVDTILKGGIKAVLSGPSSTDRKAKVSVGAEDGDNSDMDEDIEIEKQLGNVLDLFRFVQGKAVFEAFYKRDLARRLLLSRSASADAEKSMMSRLRTGIPSAC
ncbi:MAG: hypothetical protein Q9164_007439 [Protoblastenia rupestris]